MTYTKEDVGCYIDGAFGMDHACDVLANLVGAVLTEASSREKIVLGLRLDHKRLSDDHSELDDATDILQEHTEDGLVWIWDAGDLILTTDEEVS